MVRFLAVHVRRLRGDAVSVLATMYLYGAACFVVGLVLGSMYPR